MAELNGGGALVGVALYSVPVPRRKVTYPPDHTFSVESKKLNFISIALIFKEITSLYDPVFSHGMS